MLELMIDARDFGFVYYNWQGLRFTFKAVEDERLRQAEFVPMVAGTTAQAYFSPPTYQIRLIVQALNGLSWSTVKPYHNVILTNPNNLVNTFQTLTHTTITFP